MRVTLLLTTMALFFLSSCTSTGPKAIDSKNIFHSQLVKEVVDFSHQELKKRPNLLSEITKLDSNTRELIIDFFGKEDENYVTDLLGYWVADKSIGLGIEYDISANLTPQEVIEKRRANCLSYTILIIRIAKELGLDFQYNSVTIPSTWGMTENNTVLFYQHVNAVYRSQGQHKVFDLAASEYDPTLPQQPISEYAAIAMLKSNLAIDYLDQNDLTKSLDHAKMAASLDPKNPNLWANLATISKRSGNTLAAEHYFIAALELDHYNRTATKGLELLYRSQGRLNLASRLSKRARQARLRNPYYHFNNAQSEFTKEDYAKSRQYLNRAIRLYDKDPRFFELRSRVRLMERNYKLALKDMKKAFELSRTAEQRGRYNAKLNGVSNKVIGRDRDINVRHRSDYYQIDPEDFFRERQ
ncbi:MAG: hypothetical protein MK188_01335 [Gammaproteobacteria bacterium]|nr:hypothetical protein [Gammaproteobacteria bacterium]